MSEKKPFRAVVSGEKFLRAWAAVSHETTRYYLAGVQIEPCKDGGVIMVATDGHRMLIIRDPDGFIEGGSAIVALNKSMLSTLKTKGKAYLVVDDSRASVLHCKTDESFDADVAFDQMREFAAHVAAFQWNGVIIDGAFPDWKRLIPKTLEGFSLSAAFNPDILLGTAKALRDSSFKGTPVRVSSSPSDAMPSVMFGNDKDSFAVIMPMRSDVAHQIPSWCDVPQEAAQPVTKVA